MAGRFDVAATTMNLAAIHVKGDRGGVPTQGNLADQSTRGWNGFVKRQFLPSRTVFNGSVIFANRILHALLLLRLAPTSWSRLRSSRPAIQLSHQPIESVQIVAQPCLRILVGMI